MGTVQVSIDKIQIESKLQPRNELNADAIQQYAEDMLAGDKFPPIEVKDVNGIYYLTSGWHRYFAAKRAKIKALEAIITIGTFDDAMWDACAANIEHDKSGQRRTNADKQKAVKMALGLERFRKGLMNYSEIARHVGVTKGMVSSWANKLGIDISERNHNRQTLTIVPTFTSDPTPERELDFLERLEEQRREEFWRGLGIEEIEKEIKTESQARFNKVNENIEWASWSWNPVTGCKHGCPYCYARDIANRFYPEGFEPTFHPERLKAPSNTNVPMAPRFYNDIGYKNVFVCSMADLFGDWVPQDWINAVLDAVRAAPQWNFVFLTKNPKRLVGIDWPNNAWVGTTVDKQERVQAAEEAFAQIDATVKFLSCEPLEEELHFTSLSMFDWIIFGGRSKSSGMAEGQPEWTWPFNLTMQAREAGCKIYWKPNLTARPREYPMR